MRRATILTLAAALLSAMTAGVAVAKTITGTPKADRVVDTKAADTIKTYAGADTVYASDGGDFVQGGGNDILKGGNGADKIFGSLGADEAFGNPGNDTVRMTGDTQQDFVNCGEDASGADLDTAYVSGNDLVDGTRAGALTTTALLSCERVIVEGVPVPTL